MAHQPADRYKTTVYPDKIRIDDTTSVDFLEFTVHGYAQCISGSSYKDYVVISLVDNKRSLVMTSWGGIGRYAGSKHFNTVGGAEAVIEEKIKRGGYSRVRTDLSSSKLSIKVKMDKILHDYGTTDISQKMRREIATWYSSAATSPPTILSPEVIKRRMTHMKEYLAIIDYDDVLKDKIRRITELPTAEERAEAFSSDGFEDFDGPCFDGWKALHVLWANGNSAARAMLATVGRSSTSAYGFASHMRVTGTLSMEGYKEVMEAASKVSDKMPWEA